MFGKYNEQAHEKCKRSGSTECMGGAQALVKRLDHYRATESKRLDF